MKKTRSDAQDRPRPELVPLTREIATAYYGQPPKHTMRGYAVLLNGRPVAVGGLTYRCGVLCAFSEMTDEFRSYRLSIARFARRVGSLFGGAPGVAVANPEEPTAARFLEWLGFEHAATSKEGEVYRWPRQQ